MCGKNTRPTSIAARVITALYGLLGSFAAIAAPADSSGAQRWEVNMPQGVTEISQEIFGLHMLIFWICVVIGVVVFGIMFYSMYKHRLSRGVTPATFSHSTKLEIVWTIIPFFILVGMAWPATNTLVKQYDDAEDADVHVLVTGYQWKWKYEYIDEGVSFFSNMRTSQDEIYNRAPKGEHYLLEVDEPLWIPKDKKVRFLITANDVIHSWWVPDFAVKQDAIPGFINTAWTVVPEEGIYRGQCAELCGKDHGFMPIVVNVTSEEEYQSWLGDKKAQAAELAELIKQEMSFDQLMEDGKAVYAKNCVACHGLNGEGGVGNALAGSAIVTGELAGNLNLMVNGVSGTAMQAFGGILNEIELASVITYSRNSWGNDMGDSVQPVDVYQFKQDQ